MFLSFASLGRFRVNDYSHLMPCIDSRITGGPQYKRSVPITACCLRVSAESLRLPGLAWAWHALRL